MLVTPGFVDVHTHYDGQATWDPILEPSSGTGSPRSSPATAALGSRPCAPDREVADRLDGRRRGHPRHRAHGGMDWTWETFPEYLDALDRRTFADRHRRAGVARRGARATSMGERGARNEPATPDEIAAMAVIVREAVDAGALGFSTSRTMGHRAMDGRPVPGTFAAEDELFALGPRHGRRRPRGVRARADGRGGRGHRRPEDRDRLDVPARRRDRHAGVLRARAGAGCARPLARADGRVHPRHRCGRPGVSAGRGAALRHAARVPESSRVLAPSHVSCAPRFSPARGPARRAREAGRTAAILSEEDFRPTRRHSSRAWAR